MDRNRPRRTGFTLVEVLVVIVIIGVLMALLVPTLAAAFRRAKEARVTAELNNLATALASFNNDKRDYPPSRIILCETGLGSISAATLSSTVPTLDGNDTDMTYQQLVTRSLSYLRKFWPRCDFVNPGGTGDGFFNDFNGNGVVDSTPVILNGPECLTFFLGGIPVLTKKSPSDTTNSITGMGGFSKSPTRPFVRVLFIGGAPQNRTAPNYEFVGSRLVDLGGKGFASYLDALTTGPTDQSAYAYFSSYGNNNYDPNDCNAAEPSDATPTELIERGFKVGFPVYDSTGTQQPLAVSPGPNPYTNGVEITATGTSFHNPNTFQILSAGADRLWGMGGLYDPNANGRRLPLNPRATDPGNVNNDPAGVRLTESDNLTNFNNGRLD